MRIDSRHENAPDVTRGLRLIYAVAALQKANAGLGIGIVSIVLHAEYATLTIEQTVLGAVEVSVDYVSSQGEALTEALTGAGFPARPAPPDDGTMGIPMPEASYLHKHAWILKQIAYGADPWTVYPRTWSGNLLQIRLSSEKYTDTIFRIDGHNQTLTLSVSHDREPELLIGLNYSMVDIASRYCKGLQHLDRLDVRETPTDVQVFI